MEPDPTTFPYQPPDHKGYEPTIGLIGCGSISRSHLEAYRNAGYDVVALCDIERERAETRRDTYYPDADIYTDHGALLDRDDIDIADIALNVEPRKTVVPDALQAGKHVLSQKPFADDLEAAETQVQIAEEMGVKLAINQNARWAPHFAYMRSAIDHGAVGQINVADLDVYWDKNAHPDRGRKYLLFYDFSVHWFDILNCFLPDRRANRVWATTDRSSTQTGEADLLARATVEYDGAQASLVFGGDTKVGGSARTKIIGDQGVLTSQGPKQDDQSVHLTRDTGSYSPSLAGHWFPDGFHGTMAELCAAIDEDREPYHSGRNNLETLELTFAAIESARTGDPQVPGEVRRIEALAD